MGLGGSKEGGAEKPRPQDLAPPTHDAPAARRDAVADEEGDGEEEEDGSVEPDLSSKERLDRSRKYFEEPGGFLEGRVPVRQTSSGGRAHRAFVCSSRGWDHDRTKLNPPFPRCRHREEGRGPGNAATAGRRRLRG